MISATTNSDRTARELLASSATLSKDESLANAPTVANSFGKLLSAQQQLLTGSLHGDEKSSANLMFEPPRNEKDAAGRSAEARKAEEERNSSPRPQPKTQRSGRTSRSHGTGNSDSTATDARVQKTATTTSNGNERALGAIPEQVSFPNVHDAPAESVGSRLNHLDKSTPSVQARDLSNREVTQNRETQVSAGFEKNDSGRNDNAATSSPASNASEIHSTGGSENETSPARQIGRLLAAANSNESQASASEKQEVQLPSAQDSRLAQQPQQSARAEEGRTLSSDSTAKSNATESTKPTPFEQLVQSLRLRVGSKVSTAVMQLHPPQLGRMRIDVRAVGDQIRVAVETETQAARDRMHERASELRAALAQHGIDVWQFDVTVGPPVANAESYFAQGWGRSSDADGRESEWSMNQRSSEAGITGAAASPIVGGFTAVGTTRLDVRI
ncbi:MAG: flagellar hook-length control protein FliK [Planctomycetes bacterium]|nr:flagellar hook-length control protein FliK [Planctomycetota bacterium]MBI3835300.1 flagellar hook-length control protein FliK [Planctomycetota bacterium]